MLRNVQMYVHDIRDACAKVRRYVPAMSQEQFLADDRTYDAVVRNLEIIGEAVKHLPEDVRGQMPEVNWPKVAGMRDVLAHAYFGIDEDILWSVVTKRVPELKQVVEAFLSEEQDGTPFHLLDFSAGKGCAVSDVSKPEEEVKREEQSLGDSDILALKGLGQFSRFKAANALRKFIESWHVSDFRLGAARGRKEAVGDCEHLSVSGDNLPRVARYLYEHHRDVFDCIIDRMKHRVPGLTSVEPKLMEDGHLALLFQEGDFKTPFLDRQVSDGTIRAFAYLVLLHDPRPRPLLCIEEPEKQLYPRLLQESAEEFRLHANRGQGQVLVSTHSPEFLNACELDEVVWLVKRSGYTECRRARDDEQVASFMSEGDQMGCLWKQGFFEGADPQ